MAEIAGALGWPLFGAVLRHLSLRLDFLRLLRALAPGHALPVARLDRPVLKLAPAFRSAQLLGFGPAAGFTNILQGIGALTLLQALSRIGRGGPALALLQALLHVGRGGSALALPIRQLVAYV